MGERSFFFQLGVLTIFFSVLALITGFVPVLAPYAPIFWLSIAFFVFLSVVMHFFARKAAVSSNKYAFTNVTIASMMGKLFLSIVLLVLYKKFGTPADNFFVVPFLLVYLSYTFFETNFMLKLGRIDNNETNKK